MNTHKDIVIAVLEQHYLSNPFDSERGRTIAADVYAMMGLTFISKEKEAEACQQAAILGLYAAVSSIGSARGIGVDFLSGFIGFDAGGNSIRNYVIGLHGDIAGQEYDAGRELAVKENFDINEWK